MLFVADLQFDQAQKLGLFLTQSRAAARSSVKVEMAVQSCRQEQCESRGGGPGLPVPNKPCGLCGRKATLNWVWSELRSRVKVEVAVLGSPSLISLTVSVDTELN